MHTAKRQGIATIMALGGLMLLGIFISALAPLASQENRSGLQNHDLLQAQYAAEAGAKRALTELKKANPAQTADWSWFNSSKDLADNTGTKQIKYNVIIYKIDDKSKTHVKPDLSSGTNEYIVQSTGTVEQNGTVYSKKTVSFSIRTNSGAPIFPTKIGDVAVYSGASLSVKNNTTINGASICSGGTIEAGNNLHIGSPYTYYQNKSLDFPKYSAADYKSYSSLGSGDSKLDGKTYYINGNWTINNNATISGDGTIFVNGNIIFPQNVNFTGKVLIISTGNMDGDNSNNLSFSNAVLISYGNIDVKNNFDLKGAVLAQGNITFKNNANITYGSSGANPSIDINPGSWTVH